MSDEVTSIKLPLATSGYGQPNTKTCWYACYAMMYGWKRKSIDELRQNLSGAGYDLGRLLSRGLDQDEYGKVCHAAGLRDVLRVGALAWTLGDVAHRLSVWGPIYVASTKYNGHAMVLYGVDGKLGNLIMADPYTTGEYSDAHNEYYTLDGFKQIIQPVPYALQVF